MKRTTGFTLIEILIAIFILSVVMSTVYAAYTGTYRIISSSEYQGDIYAMARITLDRMTKDLEAMSRFQDKLEFISRPPELGSRENLEISFRARAHLSFDDANTTGGMTAVRYRVEEDDGGNSYMLYRDEDPILQESVSGIQKNGFAVCDRIKKVEYKFYDDKGREYESWDSRSTADLQKDQAPVMVSITLYLINPDDEEKPYTFTTRVHIPVNRRAS
jgi:general secretion pathway protein J